MSAIAEDLTAQIAAILEEVLSHGIADVGDRDLLNEPFAVLGVNSVDYLEFILNLEAELNLDIPDEAMMDPSLNSVQGWSTYLASNAARLSTVAV